MTRACSLVQEDRPTALRNREKNEHCSPQFLNGSGFVFAIGTFAWFDVVADGGAGSRRGYWLLDTRWRGLHRKVKPRVLRISVRIPVARHQGRYALIIL